MGESALPQTPATRSYRASVGLTDGPDASVPIVRHRRSVRRRHRPTGAPRRRRCRSSGTRIRPERAMGFATAGIALPIVPRCDRRPRCTASAPRLPVGQLLLLFPAPPARLTPPSRLFHTSFRFNAIARVAAFAPFTHRAMPCETSLRRPFRAIARTRLRSCAAPGGTNRGTPRPSCQRRSHPVRPRVEPRVPRRALGSTQRRPPLRRRGRPQASRRCARS